MAHDQTLEAPAGRPPLLEKQLGLWDVYALATGATLSSGFFLLPGLAAAGAGPAMPLSYLLGALILLPGLFSMVELATAMPRAGGVYYFLDRSMGPLVGAIGGFGTWISVVLKSAFALIGVGAYVGLFVPGVEMGPIAGGFAVFFGVVNYFGAKKSGSFQIFLLIGLLILLLWFCGFGLLQTDIGRLSGFFGSGSAGIISTAGLVIVSYMGLTKVASVAEEVKSPERNLPLGMFLAFASIIAIYVVGTTVMVGVVGVDTLARDGGDLTPVATVAEALVGPWGALIMTVAAVLAFSSVANAGILSASRYPLAMGRDRVLPGLFGRIGRRGTPTIGIAVTVALILLSVTLFDPTRIAKLASAFQLMMFALACLAVIVMRESRIESYDPGYRVSSLPGRPDPRHSWCLLADREHGAAPDPFHRRPDYVRRDVVHLLRPRSSRPGRRDLPRLRAAGTAAIRRLGSRATRGHEGAGSPRGRSLRRALHCGSSDRSVWFDRLRGPRHAGI